MLLKTGYRSFDVDEISKLKQKHNNFNVKANLSKLIKNVENIDLSDHLKLD